MVQSEERQNVELIALSNRILDLTKRIHELTLAHARADGGPPRRRSEGSLQDVRGTAREEAVDERRYPVPRPFRIARGSHDTMGGHRRSPPLVERRMSREAGTGTTWAPVGWATSTIEGLSASGCVQGTSAPRSPSGGGGRGGGEGWQSQVPAARSELDEVLPRSTSRSVSNLVGRIDGRTDRAGWSSWSPLASSWENGGSTGVDPCSRTAALLQWRDAAVTSRLDLRGRAFEEGQVPDLGRLEVDAVRDVSRIHPRTPARTRRRPCGSPTGLPTRPSDRRGRRCRTG